MTGVEQLPNDPQALKEIIRRQQAELERRDSELGQRESALSLCDIRIERIQQEAAAAVAQRVAAIAERDAAIEQVKREAAQQMEALRLKHQAEIAAILSRFYGPRTERFDPAQLLLFGKLVDTAPLDTAAVERESGQKLQTRRARHKHGRGKLPEHLPRVRVELDLPEDKKPCPCCRKLRLRIGEEVTEQLEYHPACLKVIQFAQLKYGCADCDAEGHGAQIELAPKPPQPIEKGLAGPGLLAYVTVSKLLDHLPLHRLERIFARQDVHVAGSTMCGWMMAAAELAAPLVLLMKRRVKQSKVINADETRVSVQEDAEGNPVKGRCRTGRMWDYLGDEANPYIVYDFAPDRTNAWPIAWLEGFQGHLQGDAYSGYDALYAGGKVIEVACWAHARRKFFEARETDLLRAAQMLEMVRQLYAVEDEADKKIALLPADATRQQKDDIRLDLRQRKSVPVLSEVKAWLDEQAKLVLPRSAVAEAIGYARNQWDALCVYAKHGFLSIDNNAAERALKLIAVGRKNWLFVRSDAFGKAYATLYSLAASARRHGLDELAYLTGVLQQLPTTPLSKLDQFLPDVWKARLLAEKAAAAEKAAQGAQPATVPPSAAPPATPQAAGPGP